MPVSAGRRQIIFTVVRTTAMIWVSLFLILVLLPAALAAQTP
jgi:hypothetical protein